MNLIDLNEGDVVVFRNGDERKVKRVYRYDCGLFDIGFDKSVLGHSCKSITWNYRSDGKFDREDLDEWANDIMKILKKDVDIQIIAE